MSKNPQLIAYIDSLPMDALLSLADETRAAKVAIDERMSQIEKKIESLINGGVKVKGWGYSSGRMYRHFKPACGMKFMVKKAAEIDIKPYEFLQMPSVTDLSKKQPALFSLIESLDLIESKPSNPTLKRIEDSPNEGGLHIEESLKGLGKKKA